MTLVVVLTGLARAESDTTVHQFLMSETIINQGEGIGIGVVIENGGEELAIAAVGDLVPICFYFVGCIASWSAGGSVAAHHGVSERWLVGVRFGARYAGVVILDDSSTMDRGWTGFAVGEVAYRAGRNAEIVVGAGVKSGGAPIGLIGAVITL